MNLLPAGRHGHVSTLFAVVSLFGSTLAMLPAPADGAALPVGGGMPPGAAATIRLPEGKMHRVTLLTGDVVTLHGVAGGKPNVRVDPAVRADGRIPPFRIFTDRGDLHVVPADIATLVPAVLDRELFNVTGLIRQGYDDDHAASLPLIVRHQKATTGPGATAFGALAAGAPKVERTLEVLQAVAVSQPKARADDLLPALTKAASAEARGAGLAAVELGGVTRVQLDRRVVRLTAPLDHNLVQVGATVAWEAGFTGDGVRVAVLDGGVDSDHPDLRGKVAAAEDFTGGGDPGDSAGHGTHVAGIIAGTGAVADGARKGVAFGATLLNGKVCDQDGLCQDSWIVDGMEWAANLGAKVANLSLSGPHSDGLDPLEEALERLTATSGVLFVVAAGNDGAATDPQSGTIGSPGEAPSALTVGAVDDLDALADFSSTGPTRGDFRLKPDLTAPGVDIIGPRASGSELGEPVGESYMKLSGTSMATPHVSGAAAALGQRFPDWSPAQLKAALVGAATPRAGVSVYAQGSGRLDVGRAVTQTIVATTAAVDFGPLPAPHTGEPHLRLVAFRNLGGAEVTLDLAATLTLPDGQPAPAGTLAVGPERLTISAGGTGSVGITLREPAATGLYSGRLTASAPDGSVVGVPIALFNEPDLIEVTVKLSDRSGAPNIGFVDVQKVDGTSSSEGPEVDGEHTFRLRPGTYSFASFLPFDREDPDSGTALAVEPEVRITEATTITLDVREAVLARPSVQGRQTSQALAEIGYLRRPADEQFESFQILLVHGEPLAIQPTPQVTTGQFTAYTHWRLDEQAPVETGGSSVVPRGPDVFNLFFLHPDQVPASLGYDLTADDVAERMARVRVTIAADPPASYVGREPPVVSAGWLALHPALPLSARAFIETELKVPVQRDHYLLADGQTTWAPWVEKTSSASFQTRTLVGRATRFNGGERVETLFARQPLRPTIIATDDVVRLGGGPVRRQFDFLDLDIPLVVDAAGNYEPFPTVGVGVRTRLYRDGELVEEHDHALLSFPLIPEPATYRLELDVDDAGMNTSTATQTRWTFSSQAPDPPVEGGQPVPLLVVDYALPLDLRNQLPAGVPHVLGFQVRRQPDAGVAQITQAEAWLSANDGATWTKAEIQALGGGHFLAWPPSDAEPGFEPGDLVSLRVRAVDAEGSSMEQTIIRAYAIGPPGGSAPSSQLFYETTESPR